ncbi:MAG: hypothetical protein JXA30_22155 [Deltaproteobacteria bacterium]|nr:hypothetical protein [Deltaproteobacteria bacterium]
MVLAVRDKPARGRWGDSNRIAPGSAPALRGELAAVVTVHRYVPQKLRLHRVKRALTVSFEGPEYRRLVLQL